MICSTAFNGPQSFTAASPSRLGCSKSTSVSKEKICLKIQVYTSFTHQTNLYLISIIHLLVHEKVCQTFGFITASTALASILTVLAMSIERAVVIIYSVHAKSRYSIRSAWLIVVLIWVVSVCSCLPPLFGKFNRYTLDPSKTSCTRKFINEILSRLWRKILLLIDRKFDQISIN